MPTIRTIENRHQGYAEWQARAVAHHAAMSTEALADRLREDTGRLTGWDNDERQIIYGVLEKRHPEINDTTRYAYGATPSVLNVDDTAIILAAISALPAGELARTGEPT